MVKSEYQRKEPENRFTLVELLVVIAIISVLAGMLLPALSTAMSTAHSISCVSKLKQISLSVQGYVSDWNEVLPERTKYDPNDPIGGERWCVKLLPYMAITPFMYTDGSGNGSVKPEHGITAFCCPVVPEGVFLGNAPSYHINAHLSDSADTPTAARKLTEAAMPSAKVYCGDAADNNLRFKHTEFAPEEYGGNIGTRHLDRANFLFLDGHAATYGAPPLPLAPDYREGEKWLVLKLPPPDDL